MLRILRALISVFLTLELLIAGIVSGGSVRKEMPALEARGVCAYVDPMIGTGGIPWMCGMLSPAASVPFGCVHVGPDTSTVGGFTKVKTNTSGYYYEFRHMLGFSLGRLSGTGARDYGMFRVTPTAGSKSLPPEAAAYSHNSEVAEPGYYAVYLPGDACLCEMTSTDHAALLRFTYDTAKNAGLYIDAASSISGDGIKTASISADPANRRMTAEATLWGTFTDRYGGMPVYLYAEWDRPAQSVSACTEQGAFDGQTAAEGETTAGIYLNFGNCEAQSVTIRMGVSFVSVENAKENLLAETGGSDFDDVRNAAEHAWEERLSGIAIEADDKTKTVFYTALYHAMQMPTDYTDVNGEYPGFDRQVHTAEGFTYRSDLSLWDTARNAHSLYTLIAPDIQRDSVKSLLLMAEQGGGLPRWPMGIGESGSMFGNPANLVLAESYVKGLPFDAEKAYAYMKQAVESDSTREGASLYNTYGYLPDDLIERYSVSKTLEYAWEDAAVAAMAEALGHTDEAALYRQRAQNYRNLWDAGTLYFRPKNSDGSWGRLIPYMHSFIDDIFGTSLIRAYCEGSARQWRWSVQQDPQGLIELFGGRDNFVKELNAFMEDTSVKRAAVDPGTGYWIGNQHDIHTPYLFCDAGRADLTQKWVRWTLSNRFSTDIDGLDGNDDGGTLSSWYVFSALGFYPIAGTDRYYIGSPCVESAAIALENGKKLNVRAIDQSEKNIYVKSVTLNGKPLAEPYLTHAEIMNGGELVFTMSDKA
ncbi:MAG: GH92 family glycosyl hydrolase [Clostridia bacterium]|nr:GH92 family glycosyl hydrolase [Clostridia bacterium]